MARGRYRLTTYFNPLPRKEGDRERWRMHCIYGKHFNPLPRKEGDSFQNWRWCYTSYFNPLPRKEGDDFFE